MVLASAPCSSSLRTTLEMVDAFFPLDYGKVRLWGSVAFVIGSALTGKLVTMFDYRVILALLATGIINILFGFSTSLWAFAVLWVLNAFF